MSQAEIVAELPKLSPEGRAEMQAKLKEVGREAWLDTNDLLSDIQKALLEQRLDDFRRLLRGRGPPGSWLDQTIKGGWVGGVEAQCCERIGQREAAEWEPGFGSEVGLILDLVRGAGPAING